MCCYWNGEIVWGAGGAFRIRQGKAGRRGEKGGMVPARPVPFVVLAAIEGRIFVRRAFVRRVDRLRWLCGVCVRCRIRELSNLAAVTCGERLSVCGWRYIAVRIESVVARAW